MTNNSLDAVLMMVHFCVWFFLIILIEKGLFKLCSCKANAKVEIEADDNDVLAEAQRVKDGQVEDTI
jgi:hypothetical protein